jgi:hypothetical protein
MTEMNFIKMLLDMISQPVQRTEVLPSITITPHPGGIRVSHALEGARAEIERVGKEGQKSDLLTIRMENVFGQPRTIVIGSDWVQVDDRMFEFKKGMPPRAGSLVG